MSLFAQYFSIISVVHLLMSFDCSIVLADSLIIRVNCYFMYKKNSFIAFMGLPNYLHNTKLFLLISD